MAYTSKNKIIQKHLTCRINDLKRCCGSTAPPPPPPSAAEKPLAGIPASTEGEYSQKQYYKKDIRG